jgi:DNA-binding SARP family transcriptional activator
VEFRVLGPVEIWLDGRSLGLGSPKEACVLAALLLPAGHPVSAESLIDHVWGTDLPGKVRASLWSYIARLRKILAMSDEARLVKRSGSYVLETSRESIDLYRFRRLRAEAKAIAERGAHEQAARLLREADQLWRGEPLAGLQGDWARQTRGALEQERVAAILDRVAAEFALGKDADLATDLAELVSRYPLVETIVEQLMIALYRTGRQAEALDAYRQARQRLNSELATEPGPSLRELQQRILQGDPGLASPAPAWLAHPSGPNNLPRDNPDFTGREQELSTLTEAVVSERGPPAATVVIIDGMPGVGKTTLAVHMAHRLATRYPDGRIFLDLHTHDPREEAVDPATALGALLRTLAAHPGASGLTDLEGPPGSLAEWAGLWREHTANRRILVVLDDAASRDQIQLLLPGSPGSLILITSRNRLALPAGATSISLDVLDPAAAIELFARIVGADRASDRSAAAAIVALCGNMPLAIQVAASRLRRHLAWTAANLAQRLAVTQNRLREFREEELEVTSSFELSYRYLSRQQQRAFRQIGCYPGTDFSLHAAAAASAAAVAAAERVLDGLLDCHLLAEPTQGRFRCHDLIREYARELAQHDDAEPDRHLLLHRLLDYYLHQADRADRTLYPHRRRLTVEVTHIPAETPHMTGQHDAQAWMETERLNLLTAIQYAAGNGFITHATLLPHVISQFLEAGGYWREAEVANGYALEVWQAAGDLPGEAQARADVCFSLARAGLIDEAFEHATASLKIFRVLGDQAGQADALDRAGLVLWQGARFREALAYFTDSLSLHRATANSYGEAEVLGHCGIANWHVGHYSQAISNFGGALALYRGLGDRRGEAKMLNNIGDVEQRNGAHSDALAHYQQALPIARDIGGRQSEAVLLNNIGNACRHMGRCQDALDCLRKALGIYRGMGDRRCVADTLNNMGTTYRHMQRFDESLIHHHKALEIANDIAEDYEAAHALRGLGDTYCQMLRPDMALEQYREALGLSRRIGDPYEEASSLGGMGNALSLTHDEAAARDCWRMALTLFERLGVPEADLIRTRLS